MACIKIIHLTVKLRSFEIIIVGRDYSTVVNNYGEFNIF